ESTDRPEGPDTARLLPDWPQWQEALHGELGALTGKNTYTLVDRPPGANVIGTRWVLSKKFDADGHFVKHKARLVVAQGYSQTYGVDFTQTYSPVANAASLRLLLAISANKGYDAVDSSLDISTVFLNGDINGDVYVRQPPGFKDPQHPNKVWKLNKALYGLQQSPRLWYMELHEHLLSLGFQRSGYESCLYTRRDDSSGGELMVAVYVDNLVISGSSSAMVSEFKRSLASKYDLTDLGELTQILGIKVVLRDKRNKCFYLSQTSFIKDAVSKFGLDYLPACKTPMDHTVDYTPTLGFKADLSDDANRYRSIVGTLAWVANWTRPQLTFTVHKLQRTQNNPEPKHFKAAERAFRYLVSTFQFRRDAQTSEMMPTTAGGAIVKTLEVVTETGTDIMWLRNLLVDLGCPQQEPTPVVEDNSACIEWANDLVFSKKNRHFHVSDHLAKEQVSLGAIRMFFIRTHDQVADILTKALN
ncbi:unnamed protein product, partial [Heterosigma akashiwo]